MVSMGATHNGGFFSVGQYCPQPAFFYQWNEHEHEVLRYIRLLSLLGAAEQGTHLEFPVYESDYQSLLRSDTNLPKPGTYACIHPGSRLASRRWPPERFAEIGDRLALAGLTIVLTGSASEAALTAAVRKAMRMPCLDLTGKTDLGALAVLIGDSRIIVCNDTGVSHIAAAAATPSIVIASGSDPERWAPLNRSRHRLLHFPVSCRPCAHESCPLPEHLCAQNVTVEMVWEETASLLTEQSYAGMQVKEELSGEFVSASHIRH
jgi:ADP-heptose:LPS heptosyltransferase